MDQITVSDIPLPGEEFSFKTDDQVTESSEATDDASNADLKTDELKAPIVKEPPAQEVEILPCTTETTDNIETVDTVETAEIVEPSSEIQTLEIEKETDSIELKPEIIVTEAETITSEVLSTEQDVECVTSDVITETVEELQMEVERVVSEQTKTEVDEQVVEQPADVEIVPIVEEPTTPAIEEEILEENNKIEEPSSPKPAKIATRTNSTIEAIKNDWADSLTIEEMNEEQIVEADEVVEMKEEDKETTVTDKPELEPVQEPEPEPVITEPTEDDTKQEVETVTETVTETTEVLVLETVNEEIVATVAENVTIEIIDNTQQPVSVKHEEQPEQQVQQPEEKQEVYIVEEVTPANNNTSTITEEKPAKKNPGSGRAAARASQRLSAASKDDKLQIPCHVLGRNVDNPTEDLISNGRTPPKPRLGVKVPYRFLTSQIVSKEEIADELIELTNKRNPAPDPPAGGDIFFASKLTQRLASKIALNANKQKKATAVVEATSGIPSEALDNTSAAGSSQPTLTNAANNTNKNTISDNSDLLAILEGDVDVDWTKEVREPKLNEETVDEAKETKVAVAAPVVVASEVVVAGRKLDPETERQLALKQLREMPMKKEGRGRPRKHHHLYESNTYSKKYMQGLAKMKDVLIKEPPKPTLPPPQPSKPPAASPKLLKSPKKEPEEVVVNETNETNENIKQAVTKLAKKIKENEKNEHNEPETDLNLNPKRVTKTYSRKEAVLDVPAELDYIVNEPEPPSVLPAPDNSQSPQKAELKKTKRSAADINKPEVTLVSKRARIIKKKVIWDPAEVPKTRVLNAIRKAQVLEMKARKKKEKDQEEEADDEESEQPIQQRQLRRKKIISRPVLSKVHKQKLMMKRQLRSLKGKLIRSSNGEFRQKKKQTELDRLLGDEGAINMLYSVRQKGKTPQKTTVTQKELLNRKKVIKDVITQSSSQKVTPKALRKKESPPSVVQIPPARKKSRDSVRSSLQSPPPSPSYFQHHPKGAEASRIIRRHSSSFSSDCSSPRRLSVDNKVEETTTVTTRVLRRKTIPLAPPTPAPAPPAEQQSEEKSKKDDTSVTTVKNSEREKLSLAEKRKLNAEMSKNFDKTPKKRTRSSKGAEEEEEGEEGKNQRFTNVQTEYKEILLKKSNNFYQVVMNSPANAKLKNVISLQMFHELGSVLTKLSKDESCQVVALTSTGKSSFCRGLDFSNLIQTTAEKRATAAQEMSKALKELIQTLAKFPKPLVASLHSSTSLLGTTMLPYFDVVLCADTATLSADYSRVGHSPEGAPGVALCSRLGPALATEMLMLGRRLSAKEALDCGLVTRVEKPDKLEEALLKLVTELGEKSHQCLTATKSLLRQPLLEKLDGALELEGKLLVEHWVNPECQQNLKKLLQEEELW